MSASVPHINAWPFLPTSVATSEAGSSLRYFTRLKSNSDFAYASVFFSNLQLTDPVVLKDVTVSTVGPTLLW